MAADGKSRMRKQRGFSLIELLIVVAIILIVAAIAIPNMLRAKISANESSAVSAMQTIITGELTYSAAYPAAGYSPDLPSLAGTSCTAPTSSQACIIDDTLAHATSATNPRAGYYFTYSPDSALGFTLYADPAYWNHSGTKDYYTDSTGAIHYNGANRTAAVSDPTVQ
jgi:type IV pilus assembly protein PilA